jgi:hypothetical protein
VKLEHSRNFNKKKRSCTRTKRDKTDMGILSKTNRKEQGNEYFREYIMFYTGVKKHKRTIYGAETWTGPNATEKD